MNKTNEIIGSRINSLESDLWFHCGFLQSSRFAMSMWNQHWLHMRQMWQNMNT